MTLAYTYPPMKMWITYEGTTVEHPYIVHTKTEGSQIIVHPSGPFPDLERLESLRVPGLVQLRLIGTVACEANGADGPE